MKRMFSYVRLISSNTMLSIIVKLLPIVGVGYLITEYPYIISLWYGKVIMYLLLLIIFLNIIVNDVADIVNEKD